MLFEVRCCSMDNNRSNLVKMGKHISDLRKQNNYTQKKLGEILDISDKTISKWEQGSIAPDITILKSLANALGVSVNEILSGEKTSDIDFRNDAIDISIHSNQARRRLLRDFFVMIFFFIIIILFLFTIDNKDKWRIKEFNFSSNFSFSGYIASKYDKTKIFINKLFPTDISDINNIKKINVTIIYEDDKVFVDEINIEDKTKIDELFLNYYISIDFETEMDYKNVIVKIDCGDKNDLEFSYNYNLF